MTAFDDHSSVVYWLLNADDEPIYIGCTSNLRRRLGEHSRKVTWWPEVASIATREPTSRVNAFETEALDIWREKPRHNRRGVLAYEDALRAQRRIQAGAA